MERLGAEREKRETKSEKRDRETSFDIVFRFLFLAFCLSVFALPAAALSTPWRVNKQGQTRLISEFDVAPSSGVLHLGLHQKPAPGWHVYWKNAGDAGYAPRLTWAGSTGIGTPVLFWPAPSKIILPGDLIAYAYEDEVVYPIDVPITPGAKALHIVLDLDYLTCSEPCVPYRYTFTLDIPTGAAPKLDAASKALIDYYRRQVPSPTLTDRQIQNQARVKRWTPPSAIGAGFWVMLLLALLGGVILNAMPCVLPVLSIKLLGLIQHSGQQRRTVVHGALASAAGIEVSFLALGGVAVALKSAGHAVGWGTQFQNPYFVGLLFLIVLAFALNLWGVFEIPLPRFVGHFATSYGYHETLGSHFFSGLFVTLLATPCSAPFLGTAMAFALAKNALVIMAIFAAAGAGMALPYAALAVFPGTVRLLPRPGAWMGRLKLILGALLMATAVWLGWVWIQQVRPPAAVAAAQGALPWTPFNEAVLERDLSEGKSVFVDITADWCFTCKYNERVVLSAARVRQAFQDQGIVLMEGDWTQRDEVIADFLKRYGRAGIPFAALYRPGQEPILLPEFLTEKTVLKALARR